MDILVLIVLTLVNGDVYNHVNQMPEHASKRDCLTAGAVWMAGQKLADSPQYLCAVKSDVSKMPIPPAAPAPDAPQ